jgi:hypothetical protein
MSQISKTDDSAVVDWLLESDPAIKWQAMRDLLNKPESEWAAERKKVEFEGWGAKLLSLQGEDGQWDGGSFSPADYTLEKFKQEGQPWTATYPTLNRLRELGFDPSSERAKRTVELIRKNCRWDHDGQPYWDGEVEECINGQTVATGAYLGVDVSPIVNRLLEGRMEDGGWNCESERGSVRSSFDSTINVLEGLLEFERATGGTPKSIAARKSGEEYLLKRRLMFRLSDGEVADKKYLGFFDPNQWHYNVLRALDYFRSQSILTGAAPDTRLKEAIEHVRSNRLDDGKWAVNQDFKGKPTEREWFSFHDGTGKPSPWVTLRALRVLKWWDEMYQAPGSGT